LDAQLYRDSPQIAILSTPQVVTGAAGPRLAPLLPPDVRMLRNG